MLTEKAVFLQSQDSDLFRQDLVEVVKGLLRNRLTEVGESNF